jgi:uncharacterized repeat protein (TIGR03803 family)
MKRKTLIATIGRTVIAVAMAGMVMPASAAVHRTVKEHKFLGAPDGASPNGGLVSDGAGNFYGTTAGGGVSSCGFSAPFCGTVFKATLGSDGSWKESVIYRFKGGTEDGGSPSGTLVFDTAGNLYGTTVTGGNNLCNLAGCGTVFKLSPNADGTWTETILHRFLGGTDADEPALGVIFDAAGNLYGAAFGGCVVECNLGTIFKLAPNGDGTWTESILYTFTGGLDGSAPTALILDNAGNLLGTTLSGGSANSICQCGTVFQLSPTSSGSWTKSILYSFNDGLDGGFPAGPVAMDNAGNLYGETFDGGSFACPQSGCGVIYELSPNAGGWKFSVPHTFNGLNGSRGAQPSGGLSFDSAGNLFGTTGNGGDAACNNGNGCGTVFELSPKSGGGFNFSMVYIFTGTSGAGPGTGVIVDAAGKLYGTTFTGGNTTCNCGVVFTIAPSLAASLNHGAM